ncbi:MAG TPA: hypothetical protein PLU64_19605 [Saprospiraceae bacterium]|nr:toxin-antitoxin system YwqK family antitoxin [Lewinellaceae bacterium]HQU61428.1 hypothetical protein [Saprospiraceae bacterium]
MIRVMIAFTLALILFSCGQSGTSSADSGAFDTTGYQMEDMPGPGNQRAIKRDANGDMMEEGMLHNGLQEGEWISYHPSSPFPAKIISYVGGVYNGPYMEFNEHGQLSLRATYKDNKLDGRWGKYSFGRPEKEAYYKNGELDGVYCEYDGRSGKIQKEVHYKNGKQDGKYRYYNEEGKITLEYDYRDGERVGGGIIEENAAGQ